MAIVHSVPISAKSFNQEHLELSKKYICPDVYPGLYQESELPKGIKYLHRELMNIEDIVIDFDDEFQKSFQTQEAFIRSNGKGINADDVHAWIEAYGFKLSHVPISVAWCPNGKLMIIDGRTRLEKLIKAGFTNVIVDVYECTSWDAYSKMTQLENSVVDPYSPHTKADIIVNCNHAIKMGWLVREYDAIKERVLEIAPGSFKPQTVNKIVLNVLEGAGHTFNVLSFTESTAKKWLNDNGYVDNQNGNGIYYKVVSSQFYSKAITIAAKHLQRELVGCDVKELRIILHTDTLDGADPERSWKTKVDSFRVKWDRALDEIKETFFIDGKFSKVTRLFGAIPAVNSMSEQYPMDRLVMFHVGRLKDNTFADIDQEDSLLFKLAA
jgi:hypothetical protein